MIKEILKSPHDSTYFRTIGMIELRKRDFLTLDKENWLYENVIFSFLNYVCVETAYIYLILYYFQNKNLLGSQWVNLIFVASKSKTIKKFSPNQLK